MTSMTSGSIAISGIVSAPVLAVDSGAGTAASPAVPAVGIQVGGVSVSALHPLPVELQVVPTITIATVALQGDDTAAIAGSAGDAAWSGSGSGTWTGIFKAIYGAIIGLLPSSSSLNIAVGTAVKGSAGRVHRVSVVTAGSTAGTVSDSATVLGVAAANLVMTIPNAVGVYELEWPCANGITVIPGMGQVIAISYT